MLLLGIPMVFFLVVIWDIKWGIVLQIIAHFTAEEIFIEVYVVLLVEDVFLLHSEVLWLFIFLQGLLLRFPHLRLAFRAFIFTLRRKGLKTTPKDIIIRIDPHGLLLFRQSWVITVTRVQSLLLLKHLLVHLLHCLRYMLFLIIMFKVRMLETLTCRWSLMRVEFKHQWQEVYRFWGGIWDYVHEVHRREGWEVESDAAGELVPLRP